MMITVEVMISNRMRHFFPAFIRIRKMFANASQWNQKLYVILPKNCSVNMQNINSKVLGRF